MDTPQPLLFASATDTGNIREQNEDRLLLPPAVPDLLNQRGYLFAVADGVGGHIGGERASQSCVDILHEAIYGNAPVALEQAIQQVNTAVYHVAQQEAPHEGMGTTVVAALFAMQHVLVAHVGDSRAYLIRGQYIHQITNDHTLLEEKLQAGIISHEKAASFQGVNPLTRAIGKDPSVIVDVQELELHPQDYIILCSDGLSNHISADELLAATITYSPEQVARYLIDLTKTRGAPDNVTMVLVKVQALPITSQKPRTWLLQPAKDGRATPHTVIIAVVIVVTLVAIGLFVFIRMTMG